MCKHFDSFSLSMYIHIHLSMDCNNKIFCWLLRSKRSLCFALQSNVNGKTEIIQRIEYTHIYNIYFFMVYMWHERVRAGVRENAHQKIKCFQFNEMFFNAYFSLFFIRKIFSPFSSSLHIFFFRAKKKLMKLSSQF